MKGIKKLTAVVLSMILTLPVSGYLHAEEIEPLPENEIVMEAQEPEAAPQNAEEPIIPEVPPISTEEEPSVPEIQPESAKSTEAPEEAEIPETEMETETETVEELCHVIFLGDGGIVLSEQDVAKGTGAIAPEVPVIEGKRFKEWDCDFSAVETDLTVKAVYETPFTVTFIGFEDVLLSEQKVYEGEAVYAPEIPEIEGYLFKEWDTDFTMITSDIIVKAVYVEAVSVVFYGFEDIVLSEQKIEKGTDAIEPEIPEVEGYEFKGWDKEFTGVQENTEIHAVYEKALVEKELTVEAEGHVITARGLMPVDAELSASKITITEAIEDLVSDGADDFIIYDGFDISILVDGEVWQPMEHNSTVEITITAIDLEEKDDQLAEVTVHRISDDGITELPATAAEDAVTFTTEHFSDFIIGSKGFDISDATAEWDLSKNQDGSIMAYWYESDAELIITGSGVMKNYNHDAPYRSPIAENLNDITFHVSWVDADGITHIGQQLFTYLDTSTYKTYSCSKMTMDSLPSGLTTIGPSAFNGCSSLALSVLPSGVTSIGDLAFNDCKNLALTSLPSGLTTIELRAFSGCKNIALSELPSGVNTIGDYAFYNCTNLSFATLPENVTSIGQSAFGSCTNLALAALPSGVVSIGANAFSGCKSITLSELPSGITSIGQSAFQGCSKITIQTVPSGITILNACVFGGCSDITSFTIPSSVTEIRYGAFYNTKLTEITIPATVTTMPDPSWSSSYGVFEGCTSLASVQFLANSATIPVRMFKGCTQLSSVAIPSTVTQIGANAFDTCTKLTTISGGDAVTSVGTNTFKVITSTATRLDSASTALQNYDWSGDHRYLAYEVELKNYDGSHYIDDSDTKVSVLTNSDGTVTVPATYNNYKWYVTASGSDELDLTTYTVTTDMIIYGKPGAKVFTINGVDYCEDDALYKWDLSKNQNEAILAYYFEDVTHGNQLVITGSGVMKDYSSSTISPIAENLCDQGFHVSWVDAGGITNIGNYLFYYIDSAYKQHPCSKMTMESLPSGVTSIGKNVFCGCAYIALTELPAGITAIGDYAFSSCTNLALTELPTGITVIQSYTFANCSNITLTELPSGVKTLKNNAFYNCAKIALTELPSGIISIGTNAFASCPNLALTELPSGITSIGYRTFFYCKNLALKALPSGVSSIGNEAFYGCPKITELSGGESIATIGTNAFGVDYPYSASKKLATKLNSSNAVLQNYNWSGDKRYLAHEVELKKYSGDCYIDGTNTKVSVMTNENGTITVPATYNSCIWYAEPNGSTVVDLSSRTFTEDSILYGLESRVGIYTVAVPASISLDWLGDSFVGDFDITVDTSQLDENDYVSVTLDAADGVNAPGSITLTDESQETLDLGIVSSGNSGMTIGSKEHVYVKGNTAAVRHIVLSSETGLDASDFTGKSYAGSFGITFSSGRQHSL